MNKEKLVCKICGKKWKNFISITNHITRTHKISPKNYYDTFFKEEDEDVCSNPNCNNFVTFMGLKFGYCECCSSKCSNNLPKRKEFQSKMSKEIHKRNKKIFSENMKKLWEKEDFRKMMTTKGISFRKEQAKKLSDKYKNDSDFRNKMSEITRALWKDEEYRDKIIEGTKDLWENKTYRDKIIEGMKEYWKNPEARQEVSERSKRNWKNPSIRKRTITSLKKKAKDLEYIEQKRQTALEISKDPEWIKKVSEGTKKAFKEHPEAQEKRRKYMLNGGSVHANSFVKNPSKPQVETFKKVKSLFPDSILNYPVQEINRSIDIAIPSKMIAIEYDGSYWHQDKEADDMRQKQLEDLGWKFIRYRDYVPTKKELLNDIGEML